MSTPRKEVSEKHRAEAKALIEARIDAMCMTWDHSFGLMSAEGKDALRRQMRQLAEHDLTPFIAEHYAKVERDTFKRAASIVSEEIALSKQFGPHHVPVLSSVRKAILSEAGEA